MRVVTRMSTSDDKALSLWIEANNGADRLFLSELMRRGFTASLDEYGDLMLNFRTEEDIAQAEVEELPR